MVKEREYYAVIIKEKNHPIVFAGNDTNSSFFCALFLPIDKRAADGVGADVGVDCYEFDCKRNGR